MSDTNNFCLPEGLTQPAPMPDGLDAAYWEGTLAHELKVQRCGSCDTHQWGPEWMCHNCQALDPEWIAVEPHGVVYSWQRVHHPVHPALTDHGPYIVVLVELPHADNLRMVGNLVGDPMQDVVIGSSVEAVFEDHPSGEPPYTLVQWRTT
ncbi:MAG: Zn-ribbon domain-containing OB-fold protein [Acidimicrobiales bacterium]|jgi:uncharacterized OB-fold protein